VIVGELLEFGSIKMGKEILKLVVPL